MLRFLHYLGFALWMGGGWATMALVIRSKQDTPATRAGLVRIVPAALNVMATGSAITVLSGLALGYSLVRVGLGVRLTEPGIMVMQVCGVIAALLLFTIALPNARHMARLAAAEPLPAEFERYRKRQAVVSSAAGLLGVLALVGVTLLT